MTALHYLSLGDVWVNPNALISVKLADESRVLMSVPHDWPKPGTEREWELVIGPRYRASQEEVTEACTLVRVLTRCFEERIVVPAAVSAVGKVWEARLCFSEVIRSLSDATGMWRVNTFRALPVRALAFGNPVR